jgi:hypothetical protein
MRKLIIIIIFLLLLRCTVTLIAVKNSNGTDIRTTNSGGLKSELDADLNKPADSIPPL